MKRHDKINENMREKRTAYSLLHEKLRSNKGMMTSQTIIIILLFVVCIAAIVAGIVALVNTKITATVVDLNDSISTLRECSSFTVEATVQISTEGDPIEETVVYKRSMANNNTIAQIELKGSGTTYYIAYDEDTHIYYYTDFTSAGYDNTFCFDGSQNYFKSSLSMALYGITSDIDAYDNLHTSDLIGEVKLEKFDKCLSSLVEQMSDKEFMKNTLHYDRFGKTHSLTFSMKDISELILDSMKPCIGDDSTLYDALDDILNDKENNKNQSKLEFIIDEQSILKKLTFTGDLFDLDLQVSDVNNTDINLNDELSSEFANAQTIDKALKAQFDADNVRLAYQEANDHMDDFNDVAEKDSKLSLEEGTIFKVTLSENSYFDWKCTYYFAWSESDKKLQRAPDDYVKGFKDDIKSFNKHNLTDNITVYCKISQGK